jgi:DNA mismatch repair protein MutH
MKGINSFLGIEITSLPCKSLTETLKTTFSPSATLSFERLEESVCENATTLRKKRKIFLFF